MAPLRVIHTESPPIHSRPLNVLRTLNGSSSQVCSNNRCTALVKLRIAIIRKSNPTMPMLVLVPVGGENTSCTASAPPPVSS